jgi:hypothetical protein
MIINLFIEKILKEENKNNEFEKISNFIINIYLKYEKIIKINEKIFGNL